jgi:hypothetical protein
LSEDTSMKLFIDVETVPSQQPEALAAVRASLKPPGTLKKPESIAAWWATEADSAAAEAWRKQSFDATHGELVSIAVVSEDGQQWRHCRAPGDNEAELLAGFYAAVEAMRHNQAQALAPNARAWLTEPHPVVHNAAFDMGYLWRRSIVNRVAVPTWLPGPMARAGKDYTCTMLLWAGFGGRVSLDALCAALKVPSPKAEGMDGSHVFDAWLAGDHDRIADYNLADALAVREVWQVLQGTGGAAWEQ